MTEEQKINCEIFQKQEAAIKMITDKINAAKKISEKASLAEEMREEVKVLLSCENYDNDKIDCMNCDFIADRQRKTMDMLVKTNKIA